MDKKSIELEWLRYFYEAVDVALGPASDEVYESIIEEYEETGGIVPNRYKPEEF